MYLDYWGFKRFPFENVPDPDFMYYSSAHEEALARLHYVVKGNKGIILITGDIGSGKTTLSRVLIDQVSRSEFDIGLMTNSILEPMDFLREILYNLGVNPDKDLYKSDLLNILNKKILENLRGNRTTLLIFDEAHLLPTNTLEEIRLLLNFQEHLRSPFQGAFSWISGWIYSYVGTCHRDQHLYYCANHGTVLVLDCHNHYDSNNRG